MEDQPRNEAQEPNSYCDVCGQSSVRTCRICFANFCLNHFHAEMDEQRMSYTLKWYCKDCKKLICYEDHGRYEHFNVESFFDVFKEKIILENEVLTKEIKPVYEKVLGFISKQRLEIPRAYKTAKELLDTCERLLLEQVKSAAIYLANVLKVKQRTQMAHIEHLQNVFEERMENLESVIQQNRDLLISNDKSRLCKFESKIASFQTYPEITGLAKPVFKPNLLVHETFPYFMGKFIHQSTEDSIIHFDIKTINFERTQESIQQHPVALKALQSNSPTRGFFDIACVDSSRVLTSGAERRVHMLDANMTDESRIQTYRVSCVSPYIALSSSRRIFYSARRDNTIKKIESLDSNDITTVLNFFDVEPRGLAFNSFGHLLVCVYSKQRSFIERYDANMKKVQEIEHNGDKPLYTEPCFVCCNRNGDVCVADHGLHSVIVVDQFGVFQFSYQGQNEKSFRPYSLATDYLGNIVITDNVNHEIHLLDKYGQFLGFLTTEPKIKRPGAVDIDEEGNVWVGESMSGKLHVLNYLMESFVKNDNISSMGRIN